MDHDGGRLLSVDEALERVLEHAAPLPPARTGLAEALGCVLAEDVAADLDLPPFDKALVDGYAVRAGDLIGASGRLRVVQEIVAGQTPAGPLGPGEAASIMTGAPLPDGADAVVMIEQTQRDGRDVLIAAEGVRPGQNRLCRGREMRAGELVLRRGQRLSAAGLGLLASVGRTEVFVVPRPRLYVVPTGDELVDPGQVPGPGQIRNSSGVVLRAMAGSAGAVPETLPIAPDEPEALGRILARGLAGDVLAITGGVSAGNRDLVPDTLLRLGVVRVFHKVRLKPGKPLWFGVGPPRGDAPGTLVFGLPGNPVSGVVGFLLFVQPAIEVLGKRRDEGERPAPRRHRLARPFRHRGDRPTYHPARLLPGDPEGTLEPLDWAGSADLRTVALADGFAVFPAGERQYEAGEVVDFLPLG